VQHLTEHLQQSPVPLSPRLFYNTLEDTEDAVRSLNPEVLSVFESSCFNGKYVTPEVTEAYLQRVLSRRGAARDTGAGRSTAHQNGSDGQVLDRKATVIGGVGCESIHNCAT
jgi:hypothetical protein